jgi:hypothetical protein
MKATRDICIASVGLSILGMVASAAEAASQGQPQPAVMTSSHQEQLDKPWPMHHVCRDFLIANSLNAADVDGDGFDDYSVIDERRGLMTIIFHPGKSRDVRKEWPRLIPLDVDGDGDLDLLGNVEEHFHKGPDGKDVSWFSVVWFENPLK